MSNYSLVEDGDILEIMAWHLFIRNEFPSYETFWIKYVVELTNRPVDKHFKDDEELAKIGKSAANIEIAQLNYSILRHLIRYFEIKSTFSKNIWIKQFDLVLEAMTRLVGCYELAYELIDRLKYPQNYAKPFSREDSAKVKQKISKEKYIEEIRWYRNSLLHGRMSSQIVGEKGLCIPEIGKQDEYLDWRKTTNFNNPKREEYKKDFPYAIDILDREWGKIIFYLESEWWKL